MDPRFPGTDLGGDVGTSTGVTGVVVAVVGFLVVLLGLFGIARSVVELFP